MNFSAKQIINSSATKLWWIRNHGDNKDMNQFTEARELGSKFQKQVAQSLLLGEYEEEMGGFVTVYETGDRIYFSNDVVLDNGHAIIECKYPMFGYTEDFLNKSILQCAFYSFLSDQCTILKKAKFACPEGVEPKQIKLDDNFKYLLAFGDQMFEIKVTNHNLIWEWCKQKICNSINYSDAKAYNESHPQKYQYEMLKDSFKVFKI